MRKRRFLFVLLLLPCMIFAQGQAKPFNKGKIVLNFGYEKQPGSGLRGEAPKICFSAGYGFTDWCVAGLYANYGSDFMGYHAYSISGKDENGAPISLYWLEFNSNYLEYGTHAEFHFFQKGELNTKFLNLFSEIISFTEIFSFYLRYHKRDRL